MANAGFSDYMTQLIIPALWITLRMLFFSILLGTAVGFFLAIILNITGEKGLCPNKIIYSLLDFIINTIRSFPFIILMVSIVPLTRIIVGTAIGERAAIVPLTITAAPFIARVIDNSMKEVNPQLIEAACSFGASNLQLIFRVMLVEALPSIISGLTLAVVSVLSATAMAGAIGAGGLGAVGLIYGYQNFNNTIMILTVIVLIILVQVIQSIGNRTYKKLQ